MISLRLTLLFTLLFALSCNNRNHIHDYGLEKSVYPVFIVPTYGYNNEDSFILSLEKGVSIKVISEIDPAIDFRVNGVKLKTDSVFRMNSDKATITVRKTVECLKTNPLAIKLSLSRENFVDHITILVYGAGALISKSDLLDQINNIEIGQCEHHQRIYFDYFRTSFQVKLSYNDSIILEEHYSTLNINEFPLPHIDFSNLEVGRFVVEFNFGSEHRDTIQVDKHL